MQVCLFLWFVVTCVWVAVFMYRHTLCVCVREKVLSFGSEARRGEVARLLVCSCGR